MKILLVCNDTERVNSIVRSLKSSVQDLLVETVTTSELAVRKILANGFAVTIIDWNYIGSSKGIKPEDVMSVSYSSCKPVVVVSEKPIKLNPLRYDLVSVCTGPSSVNRCGEVCRLAAHAARPTQIQVFEERMHGLRTKAFA